MTDVDGNVYNTVKIGDQCWMKENLRTSRYADGTAIEAGTSESTTIPYRYTPAYFGYDVAMGYLYNGSAVMHGASPSSANPSGVQGVCPTGWHVPSDAEWNQLTNYVRNQSSQYACGGNNSYIAKALAATTWWGSREDYCAVGNDRSTNNATGFSALPTGCYWGGISSNMAYARFWSATSDDGSYYEGRVLDVNEAYVSHCLNPVGKGFSVRCLRD